MGMSMVYQLTESIRMGIMSHLIADGYQETNSKPIGAQLIHIRHTMRYKMSGLCGGGIDMVTLAHCAWSLAMVKRPGRSKGSMSSAQDAVIVDAQRGEKGRAIDLITSSTKYPFHARCKSVPAQ